MKKLNAKEEINIVKAQLLVTYETKLFNTGRKKVTGKN